MADKRCKDINWRISTNFDGTVPSHDAHLAVLMDLRDELKAMRSELASIRSTLHCRNCQLIPRKLDRIGLAASKILAHITGEKK